MHRIDYYFPKTRKGSRSGNCIICGVWIHGAGHSKSQHLRVCFPAGAKLVNEANRRAHAKTKARKAADVAQAALLAQQSLQRSAQQQIPVAPNQNRQGQSFQLPAAVNQNGMHGQMPPAQAPASANGNHLLRHLLAAKVRVGPNQNGLLRQPQPVQLPAQPVQPLAMPNQNGHPIQPQPRQYPAQSVQLHAQPRQLLPTQDHNQNPLVQLLAPIPIHPAQVGPEPIQWNATNFVHGIPVTPNWPPLMNALPVLHMFPQAWNLNYNQPFFFPFYDFHQGQTIAPVNPMPLAPPPNDDDN